MRLFADPAIDRNALASKTLYLVSYNLRMENLCIKSQMRVNVFPTAKNIYGAGTGRTITL